MYFPDRDRDAEGKYVFLYTQKMVGRRVKPNADLLKEIEGGVGALADNVGKVPGTAIAPFGSPLIAEVFRVTQPKK